jgi:RNA polymerase sigma factor (sigma-70 family)
VEKPVANERVNRGIGELLRASRRHDAESQTDGQLLEQFLHRHDEAAFAVLVKRHGPMVLGVCRRILGNAADAEDAFQAAFIVLVRKAASLTSHTELGAWLHGVARRTALNAKRAAALRRRKEMAMARPETQNEEVRDDRLALLDEALSRLPEKYRLAIVLCELEGRTRREAAKRLGWPEGTVAGRLARGRELLAKQLLRRGLSASAGSMTVGLFGDAASACVPASLASSTIKAATLIAAGQAATTGAISAPIVALAEGVLQSMFLSKLKIAAATLLITVLLAAGGTAGVLTYRDGVEKPEAEQQPAAPKRGQEKPEIPQRKSQAQLEPEKKAPAPEEARKVDRIQPGDLLHISVDGTVKVGEIDRVFEVEPSGKVALGLGYGRVNVKGMTLEEAEKTIHEHLAKLFRKVTVMITRPLPDNPVLERRVWELEKEVRELRSLVDELRKKTRN